MERGSRGEGVRVHEMADGFDEMGGSGLDKMDWDALEMEREGRVEEGRARDGEGDGGRGEQEKRGRVGMRIRR